MKRASVPFADQCVYAQLPRPEREFKFHPVRKWRFDFCWPSKSLAVEVEGGVFVQGRHTRGAGMERDMEKYAEAMLLGWRVLRVSTRQIQSGQALTWVERLLTP